MGACMSSPSGDPAAEARSKQIDQALKEDARRMQKEIKLLLLGAGASGKSTVLKQMRYINNLPFDDDEIEDYRKIVFTNIVGGMRSIIDQLDELALPISNENRRYVSMVDSEPAINTGEVFPPRYLQALRALWSDPTVQEVYAKAHEYALQENMSYFYREGKLESLFDPEYKPDDDDILRVRAKTTGISETKFEDKGAGVVYRVMDVGGQRSERRKWAGCFEGVTSIIFVVALSDYNAGIIEDTSANGMNESLILWDSIVNSQWFVKTSFILFLNKADVCMEKIRDPQQQIKANFPDFPGKPGSFNDCVDYFKGRFKSLSKTPGKEIYMHVTTAVEKENIKVVMAACQDTIVRAMLADMAIL